MPLDLDEVKSALEVATTEQRAQWAESYVDLFTDAAEGGVVDVLTEVERAAGIALGPSFSAATLQREMTGRALTWAGITADGLLSDVAATVVAVSQRTGDPTVVEQELNSLFSGWVADGTIDPATGLKLTEPWKLEQISRTHHTGAYNQGRYETMTDPDLEDVVVAFQYVAVFDDRTSLFCRGWNGEIIPNTPENQAMVQELLPPNHQSCRSTLVPVIQGEEFEPTETIPNVEPNKGFGKVVELAKDAGFRVLAKKRPKTRSAA